MKNLRIGDNVKVLKGIGRKKLKMGLPSEGVVKMINEKKGLVIVEGVNLRKKALKPSQERPDGGIVEVEGPIAISNVALISPKEGKATRVRVTREKGKRIRTAVKCGTEL